MERREREMKKEFQTDLPSIHMKGNDTPAIYSKAVRVKTC